MGGFNIRLLKLHIKYCEFVGATIGRPLSEALL